MSRKAFNLFVIVGPSGVGKSYLMQQLATKYPDRIDSPLLLTTRPARPGEIAMDRRFVDPKTFLSMKLAKDFAWTGSFYGNDYGYTHAAITPLTKHLIINALPPMIEEFSQLDNVIMIGLTIESDHTNLLAMRLQQRGDPSESIAKRQEGWRKDLKIMQDYTTIVNRSGKVFTIIDDKTIEAEVLPYIASIIET